ncbi:MAG TPA: M48 family metallopeptidase [Candidatus Saccharimonadales bacterium]|nr:M48 family metallopeptidase [Candidatus Saccharimonadales bacterium]
MKTSAVIEEGTGSVEPLEAFLGEIKPSEPSLLYKAGLACLAFAMVLLPAIYLGLIAFVAYGVLWHLTHNLSILSERGGGALYKLLAYLGPAFIGATLVVFMVKPFFAKSTKARDPVSLDPAQERLLYAFIQKITSLVKAPMPCRIDVDCQVNASASFRRGLLSKDLVLTIGLPLVAGLNMREFAGVLAHEFGHFAQGAGMRLTYVVRSVNHWFARVVYERDEWDLQLAQSAKSIDIRLGLVLHAARGCIWLTRRLLWVLMNVGHALSCFMLRQMEYDADSYEAKVAGSDVFEATSTRLRQLNVGVQLAMQDVRHDWTAQRLPESLPILVHHKSTHLPAEILEKLEKADSEAKTKIFDTHPCDKDRTKAARALSEPGVFQLEKEAALLFADFGRISKAATVHLYKNEMELEFQEENLISAEEALKESAANVATDNAFRTIYGKVDATFKPLLVGDVTLSPLENSTTTLARWSEARKLSESHRPTAETESEKTEALHDEFAKFNLAHHLLRANFTVTASAFSIPESATSVAEQESHVTEALSRISCELGKGSSELEQFVEATRTRIISALELLQSPNLAMENRESLLAEAKLLLPILGCLGKMLPRLREMVQQRDGFLILLKNRGNQANPAAVDQEIDRVGRELRNTLEEVQSGLKEHMYPFSHAQGQLTLRDYAKHGKKCDNEFELLYLDSSAHVERLFTLHYRVLGRLLVIVSEVEKTLSLLTSNP